LQSIYTGDKAMLRGAGIGFNQSDLICPNNCDEGYVVDVKIMIDPDRQLTSDYSKKIIDDFKKDSKVNEYDSIPEKFKLLKANDIELRDKVSGYISYKIVRLNRAKIGDKTCNRYGSI
jgi:hypothetical protein